MNIRIKLLLKQLVEELKKLEKYKRKEEEDEYDYYCYPFYLIKIEYGEDWVESIIIDDDNEIERIFINYNLDKEIQEGSVLVVENKQKLVEELTYLKKKLQEKEKSFRRD